MKKISIWKKVLVMTLVMATLSPLSTFAIDPTPFSDPDVAAPPAEQNGPNLPNGATPTGSGGSDLQGPLLNNGDYYSNTGTTGGLQGPLMQNGDYYSSSASSGKMDLASLITKITSYMNMILGLLMGFAILAFVYFVIKYFILPNEDRKQAGSYVMYSVIGFFIILSFWGLVNIVQNTFGLQNESHDSWSSIQNLFPSR